MGLILLESKRDKIAAQTRFVEYLNAVWRQRERRRVGWRPGNRELEITHNGRYWFASVAPGRGHNTTRYWNSVGTYQDGGNLEITVEINIPVANDERRVAGFFAREQTTGTIYLMHDGSVGGGRKGVNRTNFLIWSGERPVPVQDSQGQIRLGLQVAPLKRRLMATHIGRFAQKVMDFKEAVRNGEILNDSITERSRQSWKDYYREFSGRKRGQRAREFEYVSRHGDIVDALCEWRKKHGHRGGRIVKSVHLDLGVAIADKLTEIYEVKPSAHRQALYTGIGQTLVLTGDESRRYLVVPDGERIPNDVSQALKRFRIRMLRFKLGDSAVEILGKGR